MKKLVLALGVLLTLTLGNAQISSPSDVTYNPNNKALYVASQGNGRILEIKGNTTKTFISGLNKPNAIVFGQLPMGNGFIVLDSNIVRAYTETGTFLTNVSIPGAVELSDVVGDFSANTMYLSDVGRNYIYKVTFGPPPFYIPTVTNFVTTGITNPSGMYFDASAKAIMIVSMVKNSPLQKLDVSNKNLSTVYSTGIDSLYGIDRDKEGNYYVPSWGDSYMYQINKYLKSKTKMAFYNKPSKPWMEIPSDILHFPCFGCNKMENIKIHNFAPLDSLGYCPGDTMVVYKNIQVKNWGCFNKGNKFELQVSDKLGKFNSPTVIATIEDTLVPSTMKGALPQNIASGSYMYRIVSTNPRFESTNKKLTINVTPEAKAFPDDTAFVCTNSSIKLGSNNPDNGTVRYEWWKSAGLDDDTLANPTATVSATTTYHMMAVSRSSGCKVFDSVVVQPISSPSTSDFKDTIAICKGQKESIGVKGKAGFTYSWTPGTGLSDSTVSNPVAEVSQSMWYYVTVKTGTCSSMDSVYVKVNARPELTGWNDTMWKCKNKVIVLGPARKKGVSYKWGPPTGINNDTAANPECFAETDKVYELVITDSITGCKMEYRMEVLILETPGKPSIDEINDTTLRSTVDGDSFVWFRDGVKINNGNSRSLVTKITAEYHVEVFSKAGCSNKSSGFLFDYTNSITELLYSIGFKYYPIPVENVLHVNARSEWSGQIYNVNGKVVYSANLAQNESIDLSELSSGLYFLNLNYEGMNYSIKFTKK
jgi:hypothetical protein